MHVEVPGGCEFFAVLCEAGIVVAQAVRRRTQILIPGQVAEYFGGTHCGIDRGGEAASEGVRLRCFRQPPPESRKK